MLKNAIRNRISKIQVDAGEEALKTDEDRSVEIGKLAREAADLKNFLSILEDFEGPSPNTELGSYKFVTPET